jgi:hypothetical protein
MMDIELSEQADRGAENPESGVYDCEVVKRHVAPGTATVREAAVMSDRTYNGWTNYATWAVQLWIGSDEGSYLYWQERAEKLREDVHGLAKELEELHRENSPAGESGVYCDLLRYAIGLVNWDEIAESLIDDLPDIEEGSDHGS